MASETYHVWWTTDPAAAKVGFGDGEIAWNACKAAMLAKINSGDFLEGVKDDDDSFLSTRLEVAITDAIRKLVNEL